MLSQNHLGRIPRADFTSEREYIGAKKCTRRTKPPRPRTILRRVAISVLTAITVLIVVFLTYASTYSWAIPRAKVALAGNDDALVFYPSGKVQCETYATQLLAIAQRGTDVFLVRTPLNFAFLDIDAADRVIGSGAYHYQHWCVGRHSLEGTMATVYADLRPNDYTEVVIEGDNHTQFGDYGTQDGGGTMIVSAEDQQEQTAGAVAKFMQAA